MAMAMAIPVQQYTLHDGAFPASEIPKQNDECAKLALLSLSLSASSSPVSHLISLVQNLQPVALTKQAPLLVRHRARRSQARRVDTNPLVPLANAKRTRKGREEGRGRRKRVGSACEKQTKAIRIDMCVHYICIACITQASGGYF